MWLIRVLHTFSQLTKEELRVLSFAQQITTLSEMRVELLMSMDINQREQRTLVKLAKRSQLS